ncbi:hypothetical protein M758_7G160500 [Ceratodon purpureus]|uniref:Uncharacterized protein n=1 Tax=Ceratodon purpureus TaxID=3225 RepID=A0A8T0H785_CERPU|nr:hypothetical protein KC19_N014000 [Ceratodon purpureus]KAG0567243.1 hypothetical protein KC19_7G121000 [Ceratodon purpureus]KAG0611718.1 hypothetical protein M758_7G160500 [Ceratodon purpureus]
MKHPTIFTANERSCPNLYCFLSYSLPERPKPCSLNSNYAPPSSLLSSTNLAHCYNAFAINTSQQNRRRYSHHIVLNASKQAHDHSRDKPPSPRNPIHATWNCRHPLCRETHLNSPVVFCPKNPTKNQE